MEYIKPYEESQEYSNKFAQSFDKEKIEFKRNGKMVNLYDWIQEQNQDLEIYEVLEKGRDIESMIKKNAIDIYGDFKKANDLRNICDRKNAVNEIFENLPHEVRAKFKNDLSNFIENGENYFTNIIKQAQAENSSQQEQPKTEGGNE